MLRTQQVRPGQLSAVPATVTPSLDISELLTAIMPLIMMMMVMMMIMPMMKGMSEGFKAS